MSAYSLDSLLVPVSDDSPAGEDLEYDAQFMELDRVATPSAERVVGDSVKEAEEPDWGKVEQLATELLGRSKDLRVAVHLSHAWLRSSGPPGLESGLALIHGLLENFWDTVHPQLDAEDDNDPTMRVNSVATLGDPSGTLGYLRNTPFVESPRLGRYSLRDLRIADGSLEVAAADGDESVQASLAELEACCLDCDEEQFAATVTAVRSAFEHAQAIGALFDERVGVDGPDLNALNGDLGAIKSFLDAQHANRFPEASQDASAGEAGPGEAQPGAPVAGQAAAPPRPPGAITGPKDVVRRIDEICKYYAKAEPSSPVPILLRRAKRLVGKGFAAAVEDLAPSGAHEVQAIAGGIAEESSYEESQQESAEESSE